MGGDKELAATFSPADIEAPLYQKWLDAGYFKADPKSNKPPDRKSTRLNSSHIPLSRMPSSA